MLPAYDNLQVSKEKRESEIGRRDTAMQTRENTHYFPSPSFSLSLSPVIFFVYNTYYATPPPPLPLPLILFFSFFISLSSFLILFIFRFLYFLRCILLFYSNLFSSLHTSLPSTFPTAPFSSPLLQRPNKRRRWWCRWRWCEDIIAIQGTYSSHWVHYNLCTRHSLQTTPMVLALT